MDDEAKELLREIRDIGLRNESMIRKDVALRKRVFAAVFFALAIALGAMAYLFHVLNSTTAEEQRRAADDRQYELPPDWVRPQSVMGEGEWKPKPRGGSPVNPPAANPDATAESN
jgi:hypothetical protein